MAHKQPQLEDVIAATMARTGKSRLRVLQAVRTALQTRAVGDPRLPNVLYRLDIAISDEKRLAP